MQEWRDQAIKNNVHINENGQCQFCNAPLEQGVTQCVELSSMINHKLDHDAGIKNMTIFLCVDAHALQHTEIHGRWSNHFHLTRLELILNHNIVWNYKLSPLLSKVVDDYKKTHQEEKILPPKVGERGSLTAYDINMAKEDNEYIELVNRWANEVYTSFTNGHEISKKISSIFKAKNQVFKKNKH